MGEPKQLLPLGDKLLIQSIVQSAIDTNPAKVVVITGANSERVTAALGGMNVSIVYNKDWQQGMATSIVTAVKWLAEDNNIVSLILAVCDQPFVSTELFKNMLLTHTDTRKGIIACSYEGTAGTPVLFHRKYFEDLVNLKGAEGAKSLLKARPNDIALIKFPAGAIDIDTKEDYENLLRDGLFAGRRVDPSA